MYVKNASELLIKDLSKDQLYLRETAINALEKAIHAVKPKILVNRSIKVKEDTLHIQNDTFDLRKFKNVFIIGGGKATAEMALSLNEILLDYSDIQLTGIINVPKDSLKQEQVQRSHIKINYASHPVPDEDGLNGTKSMIKIIERSRKDDLVVCLISGGGSALLPLPISSIKLKDLQLTNSLLLASGASIQEINTIRKHLSCFKGGNLAKTIYKVSGATLISIIISDVVGNDLASIASGPTVPDPTTFSDAIVILEKYKIYEEIPESARQYLTKGLADDTLETPKLGNNCFKNVHNYLIGSVKSGAEEAISYLEKEEFTTKYFSNKIEGEARDFGKSFFHTILQEFSPSKEYSKLALVGTGELTVTIKGSGIGGRNQEMLLSFLTHIKDHNLDFNFLIFGANLDGIEGNSKSMGALIDNSVLKKIVQENIEAEKFIHSNDSNSFFKLVNSQLLTGPTGCNVNDLIIALLQRKRVT
ncbi:MAG: glycerate kinase type-2 family protein [Promethearchaeota archaeon]